MDYTNQRFPHIIIIGNGFDLNLGLKTSYSDFVKSDNFKDLIKENNALAGYLQEKHNLKLWIDIENELKDYSQLDSDTLENDYDCLCSALIDYLNEIDYTTVNKESEAYLLLRNITTLDYLILDFNYTNTVEKILQELGKPLEEINTRIKKVHGSITIGQIIFGVEDAALIKPKHIFLKKTCNVNYLAIDFNNFLKLSDQISFFGHSLGETDHMYFKEFFSGSSFNQYGNKKLYLYFYGKEGFRGLHVQLDNLTGQRVGYLKQYNQFIQIDVSLASQYSQVRS